MTPLAACVWKVGWQKALSQSLKLRSAVGIVDVSDIYGLNPTIKAIFLFADQFLRNSKNKLQKVQGITIFNLPIFATWWSFLHSVYYSNKVVYRSLVQCGAACSRLDGCSAFHWEKTQETCSLGSRPDLVQASSSQDTLNSLPVHVNLDYRDPPATVTYEGASLLFNSWLQILGSQRIYLF